MADVVCLGVSPHRLCFDSSPPCVQSKDLRRRFVIYPIAPEKARNMKKMLFCGVWTIKLPRNLNVQTSQ
jgi:uncharacterized protein (DUF1499 family)